MIQRTYHQVVVPCCNNIGLTTHCVQLVDGGLVWLVDKEGWSLVPNHGDKSIRITKPLRGCLVTCNHSQLAKRDRRMNKILQGFVECSTSLGH